ncbi:MAG: gliding motility protein GldL [Muribaculaceae bacterium]|nr:gliding motility protein GldL [Muribaculaceae bacterium]MBR5118625.1 gliding motility protein GldL [Muribaculaceae bacterium]
MATDKQTTKMQRKRKRQMITQRFFNFAYSIGAAIVIWGALFKILHLPMGNLLLTIGMGTEVLMFIITAFERPEKEYHWEDVFPILDSGDPDDRPDFEGGLGGVGGNITINGDISGAEGGEIAIAAPPAQPQSPGTVITVGDLPGDGSPAVVASPEVAEAIATMTQEEVKAVMGLPQGLQLTDEETQSLSESIARMNAASDQLSKMAELTEATQQYLSQMATISEQMQRLGETTTALNEVQQQLLGSYEAITSNSQNISQNTTGYVEQMEALNRNVTGLNTIYEIQLKSISSQLDSIDRVNSGLKDIRDMYEKSAAESARYCDETEKMAHYMKQLNSVYEKMINAMTVNMYQPMPGGMPAMPVNMPQPDNTNGTMANNNVE